MGQDNWVIVLIDEVLSKVQGKNLGHETGLKAGSERSKEEIDPRI